MAGAIRSLLDDSTRRQALGDRARARIVAEFPIERMERGYVQLFENLAGAPRSRFLRPPAPERV